MLLINLSLIFHFGKGKRVNSKDEKGVSFEIT